MADPVPIEQAAAELDIGASTLRRWVREGCPVARKGRRGRGRATLVDPEAAAAWRRAEGGEDALRTLAGEVPELLASAMAEAHRLTDGPHKVAVAGALAGAWYLGAVAILDRMRRDVPELPELAAVPEKITRLRAIFARVASVKSGQPPEAW